MAMEKVPMTVEGFKKLEAELHRLKVEERPRIIQQISDAREHGDLSENAEYHAAKEAQGLNEARVAELEDKLGARRGHRHRPSCRGSTVKFGATVTLEDEDSGDKVKYKIVGEHEANVREGKISITSPIARALIGKSKGDSAEVTTPQGRAQLRDPEDRIQVGRSAAAGAWWQYSSRCKLSWIVAILPYQRCCRRACAEPAVDLMPSRTP